MLAGLVVHVHHHGTDLGSLLDVLLGMNNHEMNVEWLGAYLSHGLQNGKSERDVRYEDTVHNVHVEPVGLTSVDHVHIAAQVDKISGQQ